MKKDEYEQMKKSGKTGCFHEAIIRPIPTQTIKDGKEPIWHHSVYDATVYEYEIDDSGKGYWAHEVGRYTSG